MVGDLINTIKTTSDFNFNLYQPFKQHGYRYTYIQDKLSIKKVSFFDYLWTCNLKKACSQSKLK